MFGAVSPVPMEMFVAKMLAADTKSAATTSSATLVPSCAITRQRKDVPTLTEIKVTKSPASPKVIDVSASAL